MKTSRHMSNLQLAKLFRAVSAALSLSEGDNKFRIIAYDRAADAIEHASSEVKDLWDEGKLDSLSGIGSSMSGHLDELFRTGKSSHFEKVLSKYPPALFELLEVPGIGPKTAFKLCKHLGISKAHSAVSDLEKAAKRGHIRVLEGFGEESEADIIRSIQELKGRNRRLLLHQAEAIADSIVDWLKDLPEVKNIDTLGSLRRKASTVGDIDISVSTTDATKVIAHFGKYPQKSRVLEAGEHSSSIVLPNGFQVDLMVQPADSYGSLLQHFTGSKHHNIALRELALKKGLSLSEYGVKTKSGIQKFADEKKFYAHLGLDWIPPELREGRGEIEAASNHTLPKLVEVGDIRGDLQLHSSFDVEPSHDLGQSSVEEILKVASSLDYQYIGVTEHNPSITGHTKTQVLDIVKRKKEHVDTINRSNENQNEKRTVFVFNGLEIDIQPNGKRALPDEAFDHLDYACVSIHSSFRLPKTKMTDRIIAGLDHPKVRFFAHPTARLLGEREGIEIDWDRLFAFCVEHDKWLEIDGWPNRLDLPDNLVHDAIKHGVKIVIDTDSHAADQLHYMRYGVSVARRGWATVDDIVNTVSLTQMRKLIQGR